MNRFAVSMTIFVILAGAGSFLAYRAGINEYQSIEAAKEKATEEAKKQAEAAEASKATGSNGEATAPATEVQVSGDVKRGQDIYAGNCIGCHGADAAGAIGPKLAKSEVVQWTLAQLKTTLYEGKTPTRELNATMPRYGQSGFGGKAEPPTDQEIADLHAYIKSL